MIERATGQRFADLMSRYIWKPMGAQYSAYIETELISLTMTAVSHFREIFALSQ